MNQKAIAEGVARSLQARHLIVLDKDDFRNESVWYDILDTLGIPFGEDAEEKGLEEPDRVELSVDKWS